MRERGGYERGGGYMRERERERHGRRGEMEGEGLSR